jgi:chlorite dismutase
MLLEESQSMTGQRPAAPAPVEPSVTPDEGWHCTHLYYQFNRGVISQMAAGQRQEAAVEMAALLQPDSEYAPERLQTSIVSGHRADFGLMLMDPDPLKIDAVHQRVMSSHFGPALIPTYSFVSMTEISEYVPTIEQYAQRLIDEGEQEGSDAYQAKLNAYQRREPMMRRQRLTPEFPTWPVTCFYPMNKKRKVGENWFTLSFDERNRMMNEHAKSGMSFAGKVSQLITVGVGVDDWEWGVTLWAANPQFLTDIVYSMRFDEASARYAEFGPFYTSYISTPEEMIQHCLR